MSAKADKLMYLLKENSMCEVSFGDAFIPLNLLMAVKENRISQSEMLIYDIRDMKFFNQSRFKGSLHYDISDWSDTKELMLLSMLRFKYCFFVADEYVFNSSEFEDFLAGL